MAGYYPLGFRAGVFRDHDCTGRPGLVYCWSKGGFTLPTDVGKYLKQLNQDVLAPVVRGVLNDDSAYPTLRWKVEPIGRSIGVGTLGIFRVTGEATTNSGPGLWSAVAKVMDTDATSNLFQNSPVREVRAYESGLLGSFGSISAVDIGLRAAEHYGWLRLPVSVQSSGLRI